MLTGLQYDSFLCKKMTKNCFNRFSTLLINTELLFLIKW